MPRESALVITVPELEPLVSPVRRWYDPAEALGAPPHVTLLYPWRTPPLMGDDFQAVQTALAGIEPYTIAFRGIGRFEHTLFLQPDDIGWTRWLIAKLIEAFPEHPPYGGAMDTIVPHLTIAEVPGDLGPVLSTYAPSLLAALPVEIEVRHVSVLESRDDGRWVVAARLPLAGVT